MWSRTSHTFYYVKPGGRGRALAICAACMLAAPDSATAAAPVSPRVSPPAGLRKGDYRVIFRAGDSVNAGNGTYYEVKTRTAGERGCIHSATGYDVLASKGRRVVIVLSHARTPWCLGQWKGTVYYVVDRSLSGSCSGRGCITSTRVGTFRYGVVESLPKHGLFSGTTGQGRSIHLTLSRTRRLVSWHIEWNALR